MYAVIMAGGKGTRLWPLSTLQKPKQLLNLIGEKTLLQQVVERIAPLIDLSHILVVTEASLEDELRSQLPTIPPENILVEPIGKNTLPCLGLATLHIQHRDAHAVIAALPADQWIRDGDIFLELLSKANNVATEFDALVTFGIVPTRPETGYGYIKIGSPVDKNSYPHVFRVEAFTEKPGSEQANEFLQSGQYLWNSGMFMFRVKTFLNAMETYVPLLYELLQRINAATDTSQEIATLNHIYPQMESVSIDYGVMEKADNVIVIPADIGWDDIGSWASMRNIWPQDASGNACVGQHINIDSTNCIIYSPKKVIATIGLNNVVIIETDDALLVCPVERAQEVKTLVEKRLNNT